MNQQLTDSAPVKFTSVQFSETGEITINMDQGSDQLIRRIAQKWLHMAQSGQNQILLQDIRKTSQRHRSGILRWFNENIPNDKVNVPVYSVEMAIRTIQNTYRGFRSKKQPNFGNFIKLVHAHELITFTGIRSVLHMKKISMNYTSVINRQVHLADFFLILPKQQ